MPVERWSPAQVAAVAPDAGSLSGARGVHILGTGLSGGILWGLCRGSGKDPYQVCVDLAAPAYKCSCPSRKSPCKHALGLLLVWSTGPMIDESATAPAFVIAWRTAPPRAPRAPRTADPATAVKRAAQVAAGMTELSRWLDDQIHQGLAAAERTGSQPYDTMAARLVDAKAPGAAATVRRLGTVAGIGPHWADRLLGDLALLRLLVAGHDRLDTLAPDLAATVRTRIGFPTATEDVLAGPAVRDHWQVLGQADSDDGTLTTRRTWLLGAQTGRFALHLAFAAPGQSLAADLLPGTAFDADLCFYPGAAPLRALIKDRFGPVRPLRPAPVGATPLAAALSGWASTLAADPWRTDTPVLITGLVPSTDGHLTGPGGDALPLAAGHRAPWWLLAAAGGTPATVAGEWTPDGLRPLAAWSGGRFVPAPPPAPGAGSGHSPELPPDLLAAALIGTARRPYKALSPPTPTPSTPPPSTPAPPSAAAPAGAAPAGAAPVSPGGGAALLEAAATALVYARAGVTLGSGHAPVVAAPPETGRPLPVDAGERLRRLLADGGTQQAQELLGQWLAAAAGHGGHVPPDTLPALLDLGRRNGAIRPDLARVAGERGHWLAGLRTDWQWLLGEATAAPGDPAVWGTGTPGERLGLLASLRATNPAAGLALLRSTWATEAPEDRARFAGALSTGLSPADDTFLDEALDDRRKEVREAALDLLRRLPGSALGQRMTARAHAAVTLDGARLVVVPPAELTPELHRDGISAQPSRGTGVQAWLLEEVIAGTPLTTWTEAFGRDPAGVVALARGHDWATPLLHGWAKAAIAQRAPAWAAGLVDDDQREGGDQPEGSGLREAVRWDLHLLLPPADLARIAADFLRREDHLAHRLLAVHPGAWPDELAVAVIETITHRARTDRHSWQLAELCRAAAHAMPPRFSPHLTRLAAELGGTDPSRVRPVAELARTLTFRREMLEEFA
ncbi:DUF5691 domain-containing protein [Actinoplanes sp. NPDC051494]|uniref:DUF5691 domain-containing protein n=1 Tax=Actinoplanes sp. NPDC051494 TaxID=3363907 RepID=UPI0037AAB75B